MTLLTRLLILALTHSRVSNPVCVDNTGAHALEKVVNTSFLFLLIEEILRSFLFLNKRLVNITGGEEK